MYEQEKILITDFESLPNEFFNKYKIDQTGIIKNEEDLARVIFENFIDTRLFGLAIPFKGRNKSLEYFGPVQFSYAKSLHSVEMLKNQGTAAFASKSGKRNRSFRSEYIIPYGFFSLYGIINENCGSETRLTLGDCIKLEKALWLGMNSLMSRSKIGHKSRLLIRVIYKQKDFQINLMKKLVSIKSNKVDELIRNINHFSLNIEQLLNLFEKYKDYILKIRIKEDTVLIDDFDKLTSAFEKKNLNYEIIEV